MFIIMGSFFAYYLIFDFLPVVGPTFYYKAVGLERIAEGVFPAMGDYFTTHTDCMTTPGYTDGVFYQLVEGAKAAGERPTAAFPSSHVGIATICMLLLYRLKNKTSFLLFIIPYILLSMATVYIQAHYVIDAIAGLITGIVFYYLFMKWSKSTFILSRSFKF
jgi:membrane-associated phospholipid phosphatase